MGAAAGAFPVKAQFISLSIFMWRVAGHAKSYRTHSVCFIWKEVGHFHEGGLSSRTSTSRQVYILATDVG